MPCSVWLYMSDMIQCDVCLRPTYKNYTMSHLTRVLGLGTKSTWLGLEIKNTWLGLEYYIVLGLKYNLPISFINTIFTVHIQLLSWPLESLEIKEILDCISKYTIGSYMREWQPRTHSLAFYHMRNAPMADFALEVCCILYHDVYLMNMLTRWKSFLLSEGDFSIHWNSCTAQLGKRCGFNIPRKGSASSIIWAGTTGFIC